jgi:fluoride ion exporter CrcB/FEX
MYAYVNVYVCLLFFAVSSAVLSWTLDGLLGRGFIATRVPATSSFSTHSVEAHMVLYQKDPLCIFLPVILYYRVSFCFFRVTINLWKYVIDK